jgi:hypothetical protein
MAINSFPPSGDGPIQIPDQLIDPVSKFRVSNPENLIDTDFEYGLQPTKWETVELINNTPSFFSKSGDTTIDGISSIITNAGTREIIVKTELDHGLAVGIPINVTGTKSITADGAYIINSIPDPQTFTYLCKDNQSDTNSILDLYSSIITGEFFQGSQLRISDSDGIITDAEGTSILTVTTNTTHGFGENTPFYFLNLNSTVAQEFQAANTASKSFDASNSATAQTFDGSNSLSSVNIDWSNSATFGGTPSTISGTDQAADRITVTHQAGENFDNLPLGTPLYYAVSATGGYFNTNPRGVVFLKSGVLGTSTSTFQVSLVPDGDVLDLTSNLTGTFQIANQARTFAGNNINPLTQTVLDIEVGDSFSFDGGNQGYSGEVVEEDVPNNIFPPNNTLTVNSYDGTAINAEGSSASDHYVGSMVRYTSTGTAATGLTANTTYFITSFTNNSGGNYTFSVAALPGGTPISITTGSGSGTQAFSKIGISLDKDIVHIKNSNFTKDDMIEYSFPVDGRFEAVEPEQEKAFYFVDVVYDSHNYKLSEDLGFKPIVATGGTVLADIVDQGRTWRTHQFTTVGNTNFVVSDAGKEGLVDFLVVGGGGGGGGDVGGAGGAGGFRTSVSSSISGANSQPEAKIAVTPQTYVITVGAGGRGAIAGSSRNTIESRGLSGNSSSFATITSLGGGGGGAYGDGAGSAFANGLNGGSGGGTAVYNSGTPTVGQGTAGQGFAGSLANNNGVASDPRQGGGGGGAARAAQVPVTNANSGGLGGFGIRSRIYNLNTVYSSGGGGSWYSGDTLGNSVNGGGGSGHAGASTGGTVNIVASDGAANTGQGGGGAGWQGTPTKGGNGGSGVVIIRYPITPPVDFVAGDATGGTITTTVSGKVTYRVHSFTSTGSSTFNVLNPGSWNEFEYLIVAGGGSGGANLGGGGGGGGVIHGKTSLTAQSYPIVVGAGGVPAQNVGGNGQNSSALGLIAIGGGAGSSLQGERASADRAGRAGGSGGGSGATDGGGGGAGPGGAGQQPTSASGGYGNPGGSGYTYNSGISPDNNHNGGGGGGAGRPGETGAQRTARAGQGGDGVLVNITGTNLFWGGGGGGGSYQAARGGRGGLGGGGGGGANSVGSIFTAAFGGGEALNSGGNGSNGSGATGGNGGANTGGGGGGASWFNVAGGAGGSGIVIIRYPIAVAS